MDYNNSNYLNDLGNKIKPNAIMSWACCKTTNTVEQALADGDGLLQVDRDDRGMSVINLIYL